MIDKEVAFSDFKKVFVLGCARSGTTWLNQMISQHPLIISPHDETHVYKLIYSPFTHVLKASLHRRLKSWKLFGRYYGISGILKGVTEDDLYRGILNIYQVYEKKSDVGLHHLINYEKLKHLLEETKQNSHSNLDKSKIIIDKMFISYFKNNGGTLDSILLEKTPEHIFYLDVIFKSYPQAKVIEIVRDGRDVDASWKAIAKTKWWFRKDSKSIIDRWNKSIEAGNKFLKDNRLYRLKYENLRHNTKDELTKIFNFLECEYNLDFIEKTIEKLDIAKVQSKGTGQYVNKGKVGNWQNILSEEDIYLWHKLAEKNLTKLGYI